MMNPDLTRNAPIKRNSVITAIANDANEHARNLTNWQQCYDQMSAGPFYGRITELAFNGLQVFHEFTSHQLHQRCNVWPDSLWLGIAANDASESRINGICVDDNDLMCRPGNHEFELMTPANHDIYGIVIRRVDLIHAAEQQGMVLNWRDLSMHERLTIPKHFMVNLRFLLHRLLRETAVLPGAKLQQDLIMMALLEIFQHQQPCVRFAQSYKRRKQVVDQVSDYLDANQHRPIPVTELCHAVGTSRRTLQYSFESIVGVSPIQYLRATRLNGVRRCLLADHADTTVADVAASWGFLHLSQFTKDYRELFGERPSQTRHRYNA